MKRVWLPAMVLLLFFVINCAPVLGEQPDNISVYVDGLTVEFDVPPQIEKGRILVPFRAIAEALNTQVSWDEINHQITAINNNICVQMTVGNPLAIINGENTTLDVAPVIYNGRTLIPARFVSEALGCEVQWYADTRKVSIVSPAKVMKVLGFYALGDERTSSWIDLFNTPYPETDLGNTGVISDISLGWYSIDESGHLSSREATGWQRPPGWEKVLAAAEDYNINTQMIVFATDQNAKLNHLLKDENAVNKTIAAIVAEAELYEGVNLDFEGLGWNDNAEQLAEIKAAYNNFVCKLAQELKKEHKELILTLHAPNSAYPGYDYATLGQWADYIVIMAYDYGGKPEPVSMVKQAVEIAQGVVPAHKLILGIAVNNENVDSLATKIGIAKRYDLAGIAVWRLGIVADDMWDVLNAHAKKF
jgi:hypothetical protein